MCPFFDCLLWTAAADWKMQLSEWRQMRLLSGIVWARGGASTSCYSQEDLHWTGVTLEQRCLRREKIVVVFDLCIKWLCVCIIALLYRCFFLLLTYHYVDATVLCDLLYTSSVHSKVSHCSRSEYRLVPEELALLLAILQPETQLIDTVTYFPPTHTLRSKLFFVVACRIAIVLISTSSSLSCK